MVEHIALLKQWESHEKAVAASFDMLADVIGYRYCESPFWTPIQAQLDAYRDLVAKTTGMDDRAGSWLSWWVYETDFGKKDLRIKANGQEYVCRTIEQLYNAVTVEDPHA